MFDEIKLILYPQVRNSMIQLTFYVPISAYRDKVAKFNSENKWKKRGIAMIPTKFGIAFTAPHLNQAGALVQVYTGPHFLC